LQKNIKHTLQLPPVAFGVAAHQNFSILPSIHNLTAYILYVHAIFKRIEGVKSELNSSEQIASRLWDRYCDYEPHYRAVCRGADYCLAHHQAHQPPYSSRVLSLSVLRISFLYPLLLRTSLGTTEWVDSGGYLVGF
jgi:hypothetical protein